VNPLSRPPSSPGFVAEEIRLTFQEFCQVCRVPEGEVRAWVLEGVLEPVGEGPEDWRFTGSSIGRARVAYRLSRDLEVNPQGLALALSLLDEIASLHTRLAALQAVVEAGPDDESD